MPPLAYILLCALTAAQLRLPRRFAFIPLIACIMHLGDLEFFSELTPVRLILLSGIARAVGKGFLDFNKNDPLTKIFIFFSVWAIGTSWLHPDALHDPFRERVGLSFNVFCSYLYGRCYFKGDTFLKDFCFYTTLLAIPLGTLVLYEHISGKNPYFYLGGTQLFSLTRENGAVRSIGPFGHAIISGTVGACILPLATTLWKRHKFLSLLGLSSALSIIWCSQSTGPLAAFGASLFFLLFWRYRSHLRKFKAACLVSLIALHFYMTKGVWYIFAKIDLIGGSTGYHRTYLIDSAIKYIDEWWFAGTDHTRHWMFSGVSWNPNHTDITNYYLQFGVWGGLPLMLSFITAIYLILRRLEKAGARLRKTDPVYEYKAWCLWICIVSQCISFISIAYFDQMYAFIFALIGINPTALTRSEIPTDSLQP